MKISVLQEKILRHLATNPATHSQALGIHLGAPRELVDLCLVHLRPAGLVANVAAPDAASRRRRPQDWRPVPVHWTITEAGRERLSRLNAA